MTIALQCIAPHSSAEVQPLFPEAAGSAYPHLATFVREAPAGQIQEL